MLLGNGSQAKGLENTLEDTTVHLHSHPQEQKLTDQHLEPYCFHIYDQIYHRTGCLHPAKENDHQHGQVYILEGSGK